MHTQFPLGHWDMPRGLDSLTEADKLTGRPFFYQWIPSFTSEQSHSTW